MTTKLELVWPGKYSGYALVRDDKGRPARVPLNEIHPRLLLMQEQHGDTRSDNLIIQGDNLYALMTLKKRGTGQLAQVIYIDPPFNTGQMFSHYDDGIEHSLWLTALRDRIDLLHDLLAPTGAIFVHIDESELAYLTLLLDARFGRNNRAGLITFKQGAATGHKAINPGVVNTTNFILVYAKDKKQWKYHRLFTGRERDKRYGQFITNRAEPYTSWKFTPLAKAFAAARPEAAAMKKDNPLGYEEELNAFVIAHAESVVQLVRPDYEGVSADARAMIDASKQNPSEIMLLKRQAHSDMYFIGGQRILFYEDKLKVIDGERIAGEPLTTLWDDLLSNNLHNEGGVAFPKGKKPEALIKRLLELSSDPGDLVLDCYAGSGTTAAVAHKLGRSWITIESGEQCLTHIVPRLKRVVDGADDTGISKAVQWKGGGGFSVYQIGKALMERDVDFGVWRLNYDNGLLIEAVCLHASFRLLGDPLKHGRRGRHYAHVTDQFVSQGLIDTLAAILSDDESLTLYYIKAGEGLVCPANLDLQRIPQALLTEAP